jgi:YbbR domain-containing protein
MSDKQSFSRRILFNDNLIKILSFIAAVLLWFIVVINVSPDYKRTIYGVPVSINEDTSTLASLGLHVVEKSSQTVNVEVSGPRFLIGKLNPEDFVTNPDVSTVKKVGRYNIPLNVALKSPDTRVQIVKVSPSLVNVRFDTMETKTLDVNVELTDSNVPSGYLMQTVEKNPDKITISGPTTEIEAVSKAVVYVKIGGKTQTTTVESNILLLDSNGKTLDLSYINMSSSKVEVTVPILKTKDVPLKVDFTNIPYGFDKSNIECTIDPKTITVAGDEDKINSLTEISIGNIDFTELGLTNSKTMEITLPEGFVNINSVHTADVLIILKNTAEQTVSTTNFVVRNAPSGYTVTNKTNQISNIRLFGPLNDIESVSNIVAVIDMSSVQSGTGQFEMPLTFEVPGKTGYWVTGKYTAVVTVSK